MESISRFIKEHPKSISLGVGIGFLATLYSDNLFLVLVVTLLAALLGYLLENRSL